MISGDLAASALKWWHEAGVDTIVREEPRDWLEPAPAGAGARSRRTPSPAASSATAATEDSRPSPLLPDNIEDFRAWLLTSDRAAVAAPSARRVGPAGEPASELMILVDMPSAEDIESGSLLSGAAGALFDRMIGAIQRSRESVYLASLSPVRSPSGRFDPAGMAAVADIARHHVGLASPKALLLLGDACSTALIGSPVAGTRGRWHRLETGSGAVETLVTIRPEKLLTQPALKKLAWEDLQRLMEGLNR